MHESIAKAKIKGTLRSANAVLDEYNANAEKSVGRGGKFTRKRMVSYMREIVEMYGDLLLFHKVESRPSSWHFNSLNVAINPDHKDYEELGILHCVICEVIVSRHIRSGKMPYNHYSSKCFVHQHFLQRISQRAGSLEGEHIKNELVNIVLWLSRHKPNRDLDSYKLHFAMENKVIVVTYHKSRDIFIFNTVLLREHFSNSQIEEFSEAYTILADKKASCICRNVAGAEYFELNFETENLKSRILENPSFLKLDCGHGLQDIAA